MNIQSNLLMCNNAGKFPECADRACPHGKPHQSIGYPYHGEWIYCTKDAICDVDGKTICICEAIE